MTERKGTVTAAADGESTLERSPAFLRPITVIFFLILLAGQFSFSRIGLTNPLFIPERLFALLLTGYLVLALVLANKKLTSPRPPHLIFIALPVLYWGITALWSDNSSVFWDTMTDIACLLLAILTIVFLLQWEAHLVSTTMLWCLFVTGLVFSLAGVLSATAGARVAAFGGGPNIYSRITMLGAIGIIGLVADKKLPLAAIAVTPVMITATILSGSRGGMASGIVGILFLIPLVRRMRIGQLLLAMLAVSVCAYAAYRRFSSLLGDTIETRIIELTVQDRYTSGRGDLLESAWQMFKDRPVFGWGLDGFATQYGQGFTYPHNIVLQIAAEGGIMGVIAFSGTLIVFFAAWKDRTATAMQITYRAAGALILTASMFSGGYYDSRFFSIFAVIMVWLKWEPTTRADGLAR